MQLRARLISRTGHSPTPPLQTTNFARTTKDPEGECEDTGRCPAREPPTHATHACSAQYWGEPPVKNHNGDVIQIVTRTVKRTPPSSGRAQGGNRLLRTASILVRNTPKKAQPSASPPGRGCCNCRSPTTTGNGKRRAGSARPPQPRHPMGGSHSPDGGSTSDAPVYPQRRHVMEDGISVAWVTHEQLGSIARCHHRCLTANELP